MGNRLVSEAPTESAPAKLAQVPDDKNSYYYVPESPWDHLEELDGALPFVITRIPTSELVQAAALPPDDPIRQTLVKSLLSSLQEHHFLILQLSPSEIAAEERYFEIAKEFFALSNQEKSEFQSKLAENLGSGWSELVFDNRDNKRDKEIRDVFQVRMGAEGKVPWPSAEFKEHTYTHFRRQWTLSMCLAKLVMEGVGLPFEDYQRMVTGELDHLGEEFRDGGELEDFHGSPETNLSLFRYTDTQGYKTPQRCMVHQDHGLVTLLPKSSAPGIQVLYEDKWIPMEEHTEAGDMLVYLGLSAELFSKEQLPALRHRVVRQPGLVRYSIPFEIKANRGAKIIEGCTGDALEKRLQWERIMNQVNRADSVAMHGS